MMSFVNPLRPKTPTWGRSIYMTAFDKKSWLSKSRVRWLTSAAVKPACPTVPASVADLVLFNGCVSSVGKASTSLDWSITIGTGGGGAGGGVSGLAVALGVTLGVTLITETLFRATPVAGTAEAGVALVVGVLGVTAVTAAGVAGGSAASSYCQATGQLFESIPNIVTSNGLSIQNFDMNSRFA